MHWWTYHLTMTSVLLRKIAIFCWLYGDLVCTARLLQIYRAYNRTNKYTHLLYTYVPYPIIYCIEAEHKLSQLLTTTMSQLSAVCQTQYNYVQFIYLPNMKRIKKKYNTYSKQRIQNMKDSFKSICSGQKIPSDKMPK